MPWKVYKDGDQFCVHKQNPDGSMGEVVHCHDTEGKANAQMKALYASMHNAITKSESWGDEPASSYLVVGDPEKPTTWHLPVKKNGQPDHGLMGAAWAALTSPQGHRGNKYEGEGKQEAIRKLRALYKAEELTPPGESNQNSAWLFSNGYREVKKDNQTFLVVPGVPVREQVMNTYLVPADEITRSLRGWNGTAISLDHPTLNNGSVNVPSPDVAIIGRFYNASWDAKGRRMTGEYWIDVTESMKYKEGQAIINGIKAGKTLETSTGYWADDESNPGNFEGKDYTTIHRNLLPDHIAILPSAVGACSIKDGCGVNRNAAMDQCDCDCPFRIAQNAGDIPSYKEGHLPTDMLYPSAFNKGARTPEQLAGLRAYIQEHGIDKPVMIMRKSDGALNIMDGNHRVGMAKEMGIDQIPVTTVDENLQPVDPQIMYAEWMHKQDQSYLQSRISQPSRADDRNKTKKESRMKLDLKGLLAYLGGRGVKVVTNEQAEEFDIEETPLVQNEAGDLSAEDVAALKQFAGIIGKLGDPQAFLNQLETLKDLPAAVALAHTVEAQEKARREGLVASIKASSANIFSDEELSGMAPEVLVKLNAQMNTSYAGAGGAVVFENVAEPLTIKPVLLQPVRQES